MINLLCCSRLRPPTILLTFRISVMMSRLQRRDSGQEEMVGQVEAPVSHGNGGNREHRGLGRQWGLGRGRR